MEKMRKTIVVADDEPIIRMDLKEMLEENGFEVVGEAGDGFDVINLCRELTPDLVLMDVKMPLLDGLEAAKILLDESCVNTIVLLTAYSDAEFIERAKKVGVSGYLVKPVDERNLVPALEIAMANSSMLQKAKKEKEQAEQQLENRKILEKAKGCVMKQKQVGEEEAFQYIRNISKSKNISMKRVAEIILMKYGKEN